MFPAPLLRGRGIPSTTMKTGLCLGCEERLILVRKNHIEGKPAHGGYYAVRRHKPCGEEMEPYDVQDVPHLPVTVL